MPVGLKIDAASSATTLTYIQVGSDDLTEDLKRKRAGVTLERYGVPVAQRVWTNTRSWTLNLNVVPVSYIETLRAFYEAGTFWLYPNTAAPSIRYKVIWDGDFDPIPVNKVGYYSLTASFRERV